VAKGDGKCDGGGKYVFGLASGKRASLRFWSSLLLRRERLSSVRSGASLGVYERHNRARARLLGRGDASPGTSGLLASRPSAKLPVRLFSEPEIRNGSFRREPFRRYTESRATKYYRHTRSSPTVYAPVSPVLKRTNRTRVRG